MTAPQILPLQSDPTDAPPAPPPAETDEQTFQRLARLSPANYDRARNPAASQLGIRIQTLDAEVAKCRAELDLQAEANAVHLPALEPWPQPVDGARLLDDLAAQFRRFLVLPQWAPETLALWDLHTYAFHLRDLTASSAAAWPPA